MRKSTVIAALVLASLLGAAPPARADIPLIENVPAATLLLPYFEVDLGRKAGKFDDTIFSVTNASEAAVLAHVTVWADGGVAVLAFNVYLTGFDVQTISLRDLINGKLPRTASDGQDPNDTISPQGSLSEENNFSSCDLILPPPPQLPDIYRKHMTAALTGKSSPLFKKCAGLPNEKGDKIARGYVTVDVVTNCTLRVASDAGYFTGDVGYENVLWGESAYIDTVNNFAAGDSLVAIEADNRIRPSQPFGVIFIGEYTFYGRFVDWSGIDQREPLATSFAGRFSTASNSSPPVGETSLTVWRDPKDPNAQPFKCKKPPAWYPLDQEGLVVFDEQENPEFPLIQVVFPPAPPLFPRATQRVVVGGPVLVTAFPSGWIYADFNTFVPSAGKNPPGDADTAQAWMSVFLFNAGHYAAGARAIPLDSATDANHAPPGPPPGVCH